MKSNLLKSLQLSTALTARGWEFVSRVKGHDHISLWRAMERVQPPKDAPRLEMLVNSDPAVTSGGMYRWDIRYGRLFLCFGFVSVEEDFPVAYKMLGKGHRLYSNLE